jgi:CRP/FNR family transcriptional regulator, cyclic AMP receptor protein
MSVDLALLTDVPIFRLLDDAERSTLAELFERRTFATDETIFHQGEPGDEIFLVIHGRVQLHLTSDTGERVVLVEETRGGVFGEISLLDGGPRTASALAMEATEALTLDREKLLELVQLHAHVAIDLLTVMGQRLRGTDALLRTHASRNVNVEEEERMTFGQRIADRVASFGGSWTFIMLFAAFLVAWIVLNSVLLARHEIDPFPYILLNLFLSMIAALQAPVIMMSQNRHTAKDRIKADLDYEVNLKAELEIAQLHRKIDHLTERFEAATARGKQA